MKTGDENLKETIRKWQEYCKSLLKEIEQLKEELRKYRGH